VLFYASTWSSPEPLLRASYALLHGSCTCLTIACEGHVPVLAGLLPVAAEAAPAAGCLAMRQGWTWLLSFPQVFGDAGLLRPDRQPRAAPRAPGEDGGDGGSLEGNRGYLRLAPAEAPGILLPVRLCVVIRRKREGRGPRAEVRECSSVPRAWASEIPENALVPGSRIPFCFFGCATEVGAASSLEWGEVGGAAAARLPPKREPQGPKGPRRDKSRIDFLRLYGVWEDSGSPGPPKPVYSRP